MPSTYSHKFQHLTTEKRIQLETFLNLNISISKIADKLQVHISTIYREKNRCKNCPSYEHRVAVMDYNNKRIKSCKKSKILNDNLLIFIEEKLKEKWSPKIISEIWNQNNRDLKISHTTIYTIIKDTKPDWNKYLLYKGKAGNEKKIYHSLLKTKITNRTDIALRPIEANNRTRFGDIEADTVLSCRGFKSCLAVFVDRKTRFIKIFKLKDKSAKQMAKATIKAFKNMDIKTITYDNGTENTLHNHVNKKLKCKSYFCRPYCSADKGSVENRNKIIRQYYPKGTNFDLITQKELDIIERKINNRPLKILGYKTPMQAIQEISQLVL